MRNASGASKNWCAGSKTSPIRESRETAQALMEAILELHGAGLERMMEIVFDIGRTGQRR